MHIGSQVLSTEPFARAVESLGELGEFDVYDLGEGSAFDTATTTIRRASRSGSMPWRGLLETICLRARNF